MIGAHNTMSSQAVRTLVMPLFTALRFGPNPAHYSQKRDVSTSLIFTYTVVVIVSYCQRRDATFESAYLESASADPIDR